MLCTALGGRCAEELVFGPDEVTTGAANDLQKAREIAARMAEDWAMGETGDIEADKKQLLTQAREQTLARLQAERSKLDVLADALLKRETLRGEELQEILNRK